MKYILLLFMMFFIGYQINAQTLYDFKVKDIYEKEFDLLTLKGKKVMIVNVASKCGLTYQYEDLENLYEKYKDKNFVILGFPSNDFKGQEPGNNKEIQQFCALNYGVTFPMMSKISVKGKNIEPLYKWLTTKTKSTVKWNFQKYMIDENGNVVDYVLPKEEPFSDKIVNWINKK